jgi:hypothetical protein
MNPRIAVPLFTVITFSIGMAATGAVMAPADVWPNVLLSGFFLIGIGLAGGFLVAVHDLSNGRWLGGARRIACSFTRLVLPGSIVLLTALILGGSKLYPAHDLHGFKGFWLGRAFVIARASLYIGAWLFIVQRLRNRRGGALYVVVFSLTIWLASVDWIMALEPHWVSTIFGVYHFAGLFTAGLAAILIVAAHRGSRDPRPRQDDVRHVDVLDVHLFQPGHADLVRQSGRRDAVLPPPRLRKLGRPLLDHGPADVGDPVPDPSAGEDEAQSRHRLAGRRGDPDRPLARSLRLDSPRVASPTGPDRLGTGHRPGDVCRGRLGGHAAGAGAGAGGRARQRLKRRVSRTETRMQNAECRMKN